MRVNRRTFVATTAGVGTTLLAGCSGGSSGGGDGGSGSTGTFRLLISDQPAAIEDFDSLDVTLSSARVFRAEEDEEVTTGTVTETTAEDTESTADEADDSETEDDDEDEDSEGFVEFDLDSATIDLTEVLGDRAISVLDGELEEGRYSGIELRVASAEGVVDGETVDVKVPSNRLRIVKPFEIAADEELDFVFDINVIKKGPRNGYNLLPVIGKSGVAGKDVDVEEVESEDSEDDEGDEDGMETVGTTETTA